VVVAYDRNPQPLNRRQRRKFSQRTNARIFVKELIRESDRSMRCTRAITRPKPGI
jgi:hypothetical protein